MTLQGRAPRHRQSGVYIIAIAVLLGIAITLLTFGALSDLLRLNTSQQRSTEALEQAKQSLIGYAAAYRDRVPPSGVRTNTFGFLPCPDINGSGGEGVAASACGAKDVTVIGRLPWRTLDLAPLRDGSGECLWYALSGNFKNNPKTDLLNWDTNGLIEIMTPDGVTFVAGASPTNRAVAVVFSPGAVLPGQDRSLDTVNPPNSCGGNYNAANYLDTDVASAINNATATSAIPNGLSRFTTAVDSSRTPAANDNFNDRLVAILPDELFARRINMRSDLDPLLTAPTTGLLPPNNPPIGMLPVLVDCIVRYGRNNNSSSDKRLPWAAPISVANYGIDTNYTDGVNRYSGRVPMFVPTSDAATNNNLVQLSTGYRLLDNSVCPDWGSIDEFWDNWKDQTFYAVAKAFAPNSAVGSSPDPCALDECLTVDGAGNVAAVVIFSGRKQAGQSRNNDINPAYGSADKSNPVNFLESLNVAAIQSNSPGVAPWPRQYVKTGTNDIVMCIRLDADPAIGLVVDPTCASASVCTNDGSTLAGYRVGNANNCKVGKDSLLPACKVLEDRIHKNNCPCHKGGHDFNDKDCLKGFTTTKCLDAHSSLLAC